MKKYSMGLLFRRIGWIMAALVLMMCACAASYAEAEIEQTMIAEEIHVTSTGKGLSNEEAARGYINKILYGSAAKRGGDAGRSSLKTDNDRNLYDALKKQIDLVASGKQGITEFTVNIEEIVSPIPSVNKTVNDYNELQSIYNQAADELEALISFDLRSVLDALLVDCPYELFWYDKTGGVTCIPEIEFPYLIQDDVLMVSIEGTYTFSFCVAQAYAANGDQYTFDTALYGNVKKAVDNANAIITANEGKTDVQKMTAYGEAICSLTEYNYGALGNNVAYGNPWQMIWVFDNDPETKVVCEGYSKAFQYLCDNSTFTASRSILVSGMMWGGTGQGPHMWNVVRLGDGKNYAVDVTNSDNGNTLRTDWIFLKRSTDTGTRTFSDVQYDTYIYPRGSSSLTYGYDADVIAMYGAEALDTGGKEIGGTCGSLTWTLSKDGELTISGEGAIPDYSDTQGQPWAAYRTLITRVVISQGVTGIGKNAFYDHSSLAEIIFPETSLINIGNSSFYNCRALTGITIPDSVTSIGMLAFSDCVGLTEITLPNGTTAIPEQAFYGCTGLASITIPEGVKTLGPQAFRGCTSLETIYLPQSLTQIQSSAFQGCSKLAHIYYTGSRTQWTAIGISTDLGYECITGAELHTHYGSEHDWGTVSYEWAADNSTVTATRVCALDNTHTEQETVQASSEVTKEASCEEDGEITYTAAFTKEAFANQTKTAAIQATGHDDSPTHTEAKAATCTEPGNIEYWHCSKCGKNFFNEACTTEADTVVIPATGHDAAHTEAKAATCTEAGNIEYWHCSKCGKDFSDEACTKEADTVVIQAAGHDAEHTEARVATCQEEGNTEYWHCSKCGKYFSDEALTAEISENSWLIGKTDHTLEEIALVSPTCLAPGNMQHWACSVCGQKFSDAEGENAYTDERWKLPQLEHVLTATPAVEATCTTAGNIAYWQCSQCNHCFSDEACTTEIEENAWIVPASHKLTKTEVPATCTDDGIQAYWTCGACQEMFSDEQGTEKIEEPVVIPAPGHDWGAAKYEWSADHSACTASRICSRDASHKETESGKVTVQTTPATTEAAGKKVYTAAFTMDCFETQTYEEMIPKLDPPPQTQPQPEPDPQPQPQPQPEQPQPQPQEPPKPQAGAFEDETGKYDIGSDGNAAFTGPAAGSASAVAIPDTVNVNGISAPVTKIADNAFKKNKKLKKITVGNNIREIGDNAFADCKKLKTVNMGSNVERIGNSAFKGCIALTKITIGEKVNFIGKKAFYGCSKLKTITIKSLLLTKENIGSSAFKKINGKATFKCPKEKKKDYKTILKKKGAPKGAKYK